MSNCTAQHELHPFRMHPLGTVVALPPRQALRVLRTGHGRHVQRASNQCMHAFCSQMQDLSISTSVNRPHVHHSPRLKIVILICCKPELEQLKLSHPHDITPCASYNIVEDDILLLKETA